MTVVSVERVGFAYPKSNGDRPFVLEDVSFELKEGALLGILGPNGAGKSTLLRLLIKAIAPRTGRILLGGTPLEDLDQMDAVSYTHLKMGRLRRIHPHSLAPGKSVQVRHCPATVKLDGGSSR